MKVQRSLRNRWWPLVAATCAGLLLPACDSSNPTPVAATSDTCPLGEAVVTNGHRRLALIVGVGDYLNPDIPDLKGPPNDARAIYHLLTDPQGYLSDEMAAVIGAISGATDTQFAISAMVLKHGDLTAAALAEAKSYMAELGQALCQQLTVEAKLGGHHTLASAAVEMEGCFRYEAALEVGAEGGASLTLMDRGWCEAFQRGFSCAAMTILNAYGAGQ